MDYITSSVAKEASKLHKEMKRKTDRKYLYKNYIIVTHKGKQLQCFLKILLKIELYEK